MKYLSHPITIPHGLESRFEIPVCNSTKAWGKFKGKDKIYEALLPVQNYLCSYCESVLDRNNGEIGYHIEHIEPKSIKPELTFQFTNLLISCFTSGHERASSNNDPKPISCGHAKGDNFFPLIYQAYSS